MAIRCLRVAVRDGVDADQLRIGDAAAASPTDYQAGSFLAAALLHVNATGDPLRLSRHGAQSQSTSPSAGLRSAKVRIYHGPSRTSRIGSSASMTNIPPASQMKS